MDDQQESDERKKNGNVGRTPSRGGQSANTSLFSKSFAPLLHNIASYTMVLSLDENDLRVKFDKLVAEGYILFGDSTASYHLDRNFPVRYYPPFSHLVPNP